MDKCEIALRDLLGAVHGMRVAMKQSRDLIRAAEEDLSQREWEAVCLIEALDNKSPIEREIMAFNAEQSKKEREVLDDPR